MWTPAKTSAITTALSSPRFSSTKKDEDLPKILTNPKYNYLYNGIHET